MVSGTGRQGISFRKKWKASKIRIKKRKIKIKKDTQPEIFTFH